MDSPLSPWLPCLLPRLIMQQIRLMNQHWMAQDEPRAITWMAQNGPVAFTWMAHYGPLAINFMAQNGPMQIHGMIAMMSAKLCALNAEVHMPRLWLGIG